MSTSKPIAIKFDRNKKFLAGSAAAGISVNASISADVALALANNTPFPQRQIELGNTEVTASASKDIKFGSGAGSITFSGSASAFAKLGVYFDPAQMLTALQLDDDIAPGVKIASDANSLFVALRWGYDLGASTKGSLALGAPGAATFSGTGSREAKYVVVRQFNKNTGALDTLTETVNSWMLPSQIDSLDDFKPGTWLVAEIDGSIAVKLGAQYGFDFNWIRQAQLGGLSGDIGLRLQLGIAVALGFQASGKYALVVGRDSMDDANKHLRLRLFKQRMKGWNFALNAGATVEPKTFLPSDFDDFVKAIFGVYGPQVVKDLELVKKWTDPDQRLPDLLSGVGIDTAKKLLEEVTSVDPEALFNEAKNKLLRFIDRWNQLPHDVATMLWTIVGKEINLDALKAQLTEIRGLAQKLARANQDTAKGILADVLKNVAFFQSPLGQWLEAAAAGRIVTALTSLNEFQKLQKVAQATSDILTKDILSDNPLDSVLVKLQQAVSEHLNLAKVEEIVDKASFDNADEWLKAKLAAFLGRKLDQLDLTAVNQIRETIHTVIGKGEAFYKKAIKALNSKYKFELSYTYQSATTKTALLDIVFDFSQLDAAASLHQALSGNYDTLLVNQIPAVSLNQAALTHEIKRNSHLEVNLPFFNSTIDHINHSFASLKVADEDEGRLLIYELNADDIVTVRNKRDSRLTIGAHLNVVANDVRVYSTDAFTYSYSFKQVKKDMNRADLQFQFKPYVDKYFPKTFQQPGDGSNSFVTLIGDLDRRIDQIEPNGTDNFGNTLISLQVSVPSVVASAWLKAPQEEKSPRYMDMSRRLQSKLRDLIPYYYFQDVKKYRDIGPATVLLVYAALPVSTSAKLVNDQFTINTDTDIYWNFQASEFRDAMVRHPRTLTRLSAELVGVKELLTASGMAGTAGFFTPDRAELLQNEVTNDSLLGRLLLVEADIVRGAHKAALKLATEFAPNAASKPSEAIEALSEFGAKITETFNNNIKSLFGGDHIRPLGTMAFIEAASALDPTLGIVEPVALMDLLVVKQQSQFKLPTFLEGELPDSSDIVIQQSIVNV